jgi:hypothetical protein
MDANLVRATDSNDSTTASRELGRGPMLLGDFNWRKRGRQASR